MLSHDLKRLHDQFEAWISGRKEVDEAEFIAFGRELGFCAAKMALLEVGVDVAALNVIAESERPDTNVVLLPRRPRVETVRISDGATS